MQTQISDERSLSEVRETELPSPTDWKTSLALLTLGIIVALILFEIGFRIIANSIPHKHRWRDRPKAYYLPENSPDSRNFAYPIAKKPGTFRVIVIGDSFTFGVEEHFDDSFSKRLERMLNLNENQRPVEVLNWGIPGYSTAQEVKLVRRAVSSYQPDLILIQVTLNDPEFEPYRQTHKNQLRNGQVVLTNPIFKYWKSAAYIAQRALNTLTHYEFQHYYEDLFNNPKTWNKFADAFRDIAKITKKANVPVMVTVFPLFNHQLDAHYPFKEIHKKIKSLLHEVKLPELDLLSYYTDIPPDRLQIIPGEDSHPNEIAHRIASDAMYKALVRRKLLPGDIQVRRLINSRKNPTQPLPPPSSEAAKSGDIE